MAEKFWYALYTKPKHEFKAESDCNALNIECYLPKSTRLKQWSDRKKRVTEPLLRGYIFVNVDEKERFEALQSNAIINTVCFSGVPAKIPAFQIENLQNLLKDNPQVFIVDKIVKGTKVVIKEGPFTDVEGIVYQDTNSNNCLAVAIEMINRSVLVHLPAASVVVKKQ